MSETKEDTGHGVFEVLGIHTVVPHARKEEAIWRSTHLKDVQGKLPPYIIVVGDRRRVVSASKLLDEPQLIHERMADASKNIGRVNIAVGFFNGVPLALVETGMGTSSTEIIVREVLSNENSTTEFKIGDKVWKSDAKYIVRVGSCAGINSSNKDATVINPFEIIVANKQVGVSGTDLQSLTGNLNYFDPNLQKRSREELEKLGFSFAADNMPSIAADSGLGDTIYEQATKIATEAPFTIPVHRFANYSKDSLYAEATDESFIKLRDDHDVGSTEMEFSTITRVAQQFTTNDQPVKAGMLNFSVGTIPGAGFCHDAVVEKEVTRVGLRAAMSALSEVGKRHSS